MKTAAKRVVAVLLWLIVSVLGLSFIVVTTPVTMPLYFFKIFNKKNIGEALDEWGNDSRNIAYAIDLLGNATLFDWVDIIPNKHPYGMPREVISYVLFKRLRDSTTTKFDTLVIKFIKLFDKQHFAEKNYKEYSNN